MVQSVRPKDSELLGSLKASITDKGLCHTINAKSIMKTYNVEMDERLKSFSNMLDRFGAKEKPLTITGSGYLHQATFWLNARGSSNKTRSSKGSITAAINNWHDYFAVRFKNRSFTAYGLLPCYFNCHFRSQEIQLRAGQSYQLKIVPVHHVSTSNFHELTQEERQCRFLEEVEDDSMFNSYTQKGCIFECALSHVVRFTVQNDNLKAFTFISHRMSTAPPGTTHYQKTIRHPICAPHTLMAQMTTITH